MLLARSHRGGKSLVVLHRYCDLLVRNIDGRNFAMLQRKEEGVQLTDVVDDNSSGPLLTYSMS
eukprot:2686443-Ditylum_brightwellii.AAC.1